jgi:hypothetical protein
MPTPRRVCARPSRSSARSRVTIIPTWRCISGISRVSMRPGQLRRGGAALSPQFRDRRPRVERYPERRIGKHQSRRACEFGRPAPRAAGIPAKGRRPVSGSASSRVRSGGAAQRARAGSCARLAPESAGEFRHRYPPRLDQWQAMLECQASLTTALGYRDLKPAAAGTCSPGRHRARRPLRPSALGSSRQMDARAG